MDEHEKPCVCCYDLERAEAENARLRAVVEAACTELDRIAEQSGWGSIGVVVERLMEAFQLDVSGDIGVPHDHRERVPGCFRCELGEDEAGAAPDPSFRFIPPTCPTCGTPQTLARKFNGGDPIAFYQPDCDCDDDPEAVFPVY